MLQASGIQRNRDGLAPAEAIKADQRETESHNPKSAGLRHGRIEQLERML